MHATYDDRTLRFERRLRHPPETVWRAISDPDELAHWFPSQVRGEIRAGGELSFHFEHMPLDAPSTMTGRVTEFDPPRRFAFYWGEDHLRFELEPGGDGGDTCLLRFTVVLEAEDKAARDAAGWHQCLDGLERQLGGADAGAAGAGAAAERPVTADVWREHYAEYTRRGFPAGAPIPDR
jgi:uncharacterized protein YndB with AHSA1/START domain